MERDIDLKDISDGKLYGVNDMARLGCNDCEGCFACCCNMGNSVILDPLDIYRLTTGLSCKMEDLLSAKLDLNVVEGIILPNLKMDGERNRCGFLDENGRCSIHSIRPGICRIFPLGRVYENGGFQYILQVHECDKNKTKVKIKKWIDTPEIAKNEEFINTWHYFLKDLSAKLPSCSEEIVKQVNMYILHAFYMTLYESGRSFYEQFEERMRLAKDYIQSLL